MQFVHVLIHIAVTIHITSISLVHVFIYSSLCVWLVALNIRVGIHPGGGYWFAANLSPNVSLPFLQLFHHFDCWRLFVSIVMISIFLLTLVCNM